MNDALLKFVTVAKHMPAKRSANKRRADFDEIYKDFEPAKAAEQASRCSQCGIPYCQIHCPLQNNIPDWLMLTAQGRLREAYEAASATNNMPEICGRICPQDRLCEGNCVIEQAGHGTVTIGAVERYITDNAWEKGWIIPGAPAREKEASVGIVGAGPGGMAAGEQLRRKGYKVEIYDRYDRAGGLLVYGIPSFKLEKEIVQRREQLLRDSGVIFHLGFEVGRQESLEDLRQKHDAVLIATGVYQARDVAVPGIGLGNIMPALEYLIASNRVGLGDTVPEFDSGALDAKAKHVVVIGGGDTAMDCVRTAVRQGAKSVKCLYRRDRGNMPGSMREVSHAEEEGVEFVWLSTPEAFLGDGVVSGVRAHRMRLGAPDASGRQSPEAIENSSFTLDCDLAIKALGFDPEDVPSLFGAPELKVSQWGTIRVDWRTMMTNLDGVFAAGDIVRGASLVVWAIRDARDAAEHIERFIEAKADGAQASSVAAE
ncbi:MAG: NAD(P)-dependent oxidoreductase [Alphaproteobacteria bacterium]